MLDRTPYRAVVTISFSLLLTGPSVLQAQRVSFGVLGGVNSSKVYTEISGEDLDTDRRTGWTAGGYAEFGIAKRVSIRPELLITEQGGEESESGETFRVNLRYVQIPLLARVDLRGGESMHPFLLAGPALSLRIGCEVEISGTLVTATADCDALPDDEPDPFTKSAVSGVVGGGLDFGRWALSVRYDHGFSNIASKAVREDDDSAKLRTISLLASIRLGGSWR